MGVVVPMIMFPVMTAAAAFMVVLLMVAAAAAFMVVFLMMAAAAAAMVMVTAAMFFVSWTDHCFPFNRPGKRRQFRNQCIRVIRRQPQLSGRKSDDGFLYILMRVEFPFNLCCTVGTV